MRLRRALAGLLLVLLAAPVLGANSSTVLTAHDTIGPVKRLHYTLTADDADGSFDTIALPDISGRLLTIITNPGATAPTDNYDITLVDDEGIDRLQGVGANRDTANSEEAAIVYSGTEIHPPVVDGDVLTLTTANNAVNSAIVEVFIYYEGQAT